jgi:putative FmdB family regulatory protein
LGSFIYITTYWTNAQNVEDIEMPIYEYRCKTCDQAFEALVQGSQKPSCPCCDSRKLEKLFSAFAVNGGVGVGGGSMSMPLGGG